MRKFRFGAQVSRAPSGAVWTDMARSIADTALMLSVMAGPDDRSPISYDVDTRELLSAAKAPSVKGWRACACGRPTFAAVPRSTGMPSTRPNVLARSAARPFWAK